MCSSPKRSHDDAASVEPSPTTNLLNSPHHIAEIISVRLLRDISKVAETSKNGVESGSLAAGDELKLVGVLNIKLDRSRRRNEWAHMSMDWTTFEGSGMNCSSFFAMHFDSTGSVWALKAAFKLTRISEEVVRI